MKEEGITPEALEAEWLDKIKKHYARCEETIAKRLEANNANPFSPYCDTKVEEEAERLYKKIYNRSIGGKDSKYVFVCPRCKTKCRRSYWGNICGYCFLDDMQGEKLKRDFDKAKEKARYNSLSWGDKLREIGIGCMGYVLLLVFIFTIIATIYTVFNSLRSCSPSDSEDPYIEFPIHPDI